MTQRCEAIYENGAFRPLAPLGSTFAEGQQVQLVVESDTDSADILDLITQVYAGLPDEDVDAIEHIALDRSHFFTRPAL